MPCSQWLFTSKPAALLLATDWLARVLRALTWLPTSRVGWLHCWGAGGVTADVDDKSEGREGNGGGSEWASTYICINLLTGLFWSFSCLQVGYLQIFINPLRLASHERYIHVWENHTFRNQGTPTGSFSWCPCREISMQLLLGSPNPLLHTFSSVRQDSLIKLHRFLSRQVFPWGKKQAGVTTCFSCQPAAWLFCFPGENAHVKLA